MLFGKAFWWRETKRRGLRLANTEQQRCGKAIPTGVFESLNAPYCYRRKFRRYEGQGVAQTVQAECQESANNAVAVAPWEDQRRKIVESKFPGKSAFRRSCWRQSESASKRRGCYY